MKIGSVTRAQIGEAKLELGANAKVFHSALKNIRGNRANVEMFHITLADMLVDVRHLVGIREYGDNPNSDCVQSAPRGIIQMKLVELLCVALTSNCSALRCIALNRFALLQTVLHYFGMCCTTLNYFDLLCNASNCYACLVRNCFARL